MHISILTLTTLFGVLQAIQPNIKFTKFTRAIDKSEKHTTATLVPRTSSGTSSGSDSEGQQAKPTQVEYQGRRPFSNPDRGSGVPTVTSRRFPHPHPQLGIYRDNPVRLAASINGPAKIEAHIGRDPKKIKTKDIEAGTRKSVIIKNPYAAEVYVHAQQDNAGPKSNRVTISGGRRASIRTQGIQDARLKVQAEPIPNPFNDWKITRQTPTTELDKNYLRASTRNFQHHPRVSGTFRGEGIAVLRASNSRAGSEASRASSISVPDDEDEVTSVSS